jgi:oxalate decarboxylase/phosphoglucose isomerase-like protein (cupin superfamily)
MKHIKTGSKRGKFNLLVASRGAQAAMMTLQPGATSDDEPSNEHSASEQWIYVVESRGEVRVGKTKKALRTVKFAKHSLLVIEKGELHQVKNTGPKPLITFNLYVPPAYDAEGEPLGRVARAIAAIAPTKFKGTSR